MAAKRRKTKAKKKPPLLPEAVSSFLKMSFLRGWGSLLILLAAALVTSLVTYNVNDPSWNNVTEALPQNLLWYPGAYISDFLLQITGLAAFLLALPLITWGWRIISLKGLPFVIRHLLVLPFSMIFGMIGAAMLPLHQSWPLPKISMGGVGGDYFLKQFQTVTSAIGLTDYPIISGIFIGFMLLYTLLYAIGLGHNDWRGIFKGIYWVLAKIWSVIYGILKFIGNEFKRLAYAIKVAALWRPDRPEGAEQDERSIEVAHAPKYEEPTPTKTKEKKEPFFSFGKKKKAAMDDYNPLPDDHEAMVHGYVDEERAQNDVPPRKSSFKIMDHSVRKPAVGKREEQERQPSLGLTIEGEFALPPLSLLEPPKPPSAGQVLSRETLEQNARMLESVLADFSVNGEITKVRPGPVVTLYELEPAPGTKSARVINLAEDIARSMSAVSARVAVVAGKNAIGIELPNSKREIVSLREMLASRTFEESKDSLPMCLGKDIGGDPIVADLAKMPHLLVAGTTGSGKSVAINTMILSLIYRMTPAECRLIMVDPKMLELSIYDDIPHLLTPVVTDPNKAVVALKWAVREMEQRYRNMAKLQVRNIAAYNERLAKARETGEDIVITVQTGFDQATGSPVYEEESMDLTPLPKIVVIVDEMADLMLVAGKDIEALIQRLAQMARAAGIHLIMATQRPSVDVITGTIKANFPTRISFQVTSKIDSRTILGEMGAEQLLGMGDMLYMAGGGRITRVHGPFVSDGDVEKVVTELKKQGAPDYLQDITEEPSEGFDSTFLQNSQLTPEAGKDGGGGNELYDKAVMIVARDGKASTSYIQRQLRIGYNRAADIIEEMERQGIVSPPNRSGKREVLVQSHAEEQY